MTAEKPIGDVRVCLDMRDANKAIIKARQPIPTVEGTAREMRKMKVFPKLDLNMADVERKEEQFCGTYSVKQSLLITED